MTTTRNVSLDILDEASREIIDQALYYREQSPNGALESKWEQAVGHAIQSLWRMPERGSRCFFRAPGLQGMRRLAIPGFPKHFVFYVFLVKEGVVRIVHIIHGARDLEAYLGDASE